MDYKKALKRNLKINLVINTLVHLEFIIPVWVAFYTRILSFSQIALFHVVYGVITTLLEVPSGALADLVGRKKTIMLGWGVSGVGLITAAFAPNPEMFLLSFMLRAVGEAFVSGADTALIYDTFKELNRTEELSKYVAKSLFFLRLALAVGTLVGGYLFLIWLPLPYLLLGLLHLVSLGLIACMIEPRIDSEKFTWKNYVVQTKIGIRQLLQTSYTVRLTLYYVLVGGIIWSCATYFNQPFAKDVGFSEVGMSWLFGVAYVLVSFTVLFLTHHASFITKERAYLGIPLLMVVGLLPGLFATRVMAFFMVSLITISQSLRMTFLNKYVNDEFDSKYRATALSALNMLVNLVTYTFIGISGYVQDIFNTKVIFTILGIITLVLVIPTSLRVVRLHLSRN